MDTKTADSHAHHPRVEDDYLVRGTGRFVADARRARPGRGGVRALAARACAHPRDRHRGREESARRDRDRDRRGHRRRRRRQRDAASAAAGPRRQQARDAAPACAGARARDVCRRDGRDGDRRDRARGAGRRRSGRASTTSRSIRSSTHATPRRRPDAPQLWPEAPGNIALDWAGTASRSGRQCRARSSSIIASAKHVARVTVTNQRLTHATMEPRGATAQLRPGDRQLSPARLLAERRRHARQHHRRS